MGELLARDGLVLPAANPGANHFAQAGLLKPGHQAAQAALRAVVAQHAGNGLQQLRVAGDQANQAAQAAAGRAGTVLRLLPAHHRAQH